MECCDSFLVSFSLQHMKCDELTLNSQISCGNLLIFQLLIQLHVTTSILNFCVQLLPSVTKNIQLKQSGIFPDGISLYTTQGHQDSSQWPDQTPASKREPGGRVHMFFIIRNSRTEESLNKEKEEYLNLQHACLYN